MPDESELADLIGRLTQSSRLSEQEARHLVGEVLAFLDEPVDLFVRRRHRELQREGCGNAEIYRRIAVEAGHRLFRADVLSERQIRRLIYG